MTVDKLLEVVRWRAERPTEPDLVIRKSDFRDLRESLEEAVTARNRVAQLERQLERAKQIQVFLPLVAIGVPMDRGANHWKGLARTSYAKLLELTEEIIADEKDKDE